MTPLRLTRLLIANIQVTFGKAPNNAAMQKAVRRYANNFASAVHCGTAADKTTAIEEALRWSVYPSFAEVKAQQLEDVSRAFRFFGDSHECAVPYTRVDIEC